MTDKTPTNDKTKVYGRAIKTILKYERPNKGATEDVKRNKNAA